MRRRISILAVLAIAAVITVATMSAIANAQEADPPPCTPNETCTEPAPPCPTDEPCSSPGDPGCPPEGTVCADPPVPCPDDMVCPVPPPCETDRPCDFGDADNDGWDDSTENEWGSDPNDANSTPEHGYIIETCLDGIDNDGDGSIDLADSGCNIDSDQDGVIDAQDNCPWDANADQADRDGDGTGDACDYDADNDGWDDFTEAEWGSNPNDAASTPEHWFAFETCEDGLDNDADGSTDTSDPGCAPDNDYDGVADERDNCPTYWNPEQADNDSDGLGDACEDSDGDGFFDGDETAWGSDPTDASSTPEYPRDNVCQDGIDNDRDGTLDGDDEGCRITFEDGSLPPSANGPVEVLPVSTGGVRNNGNTTASESTSAPGLPLAGYGASRDGGTAWWLIAASVGALVLVSGASLYGVRVRQRP